MYHQSFSIILVEAIKLENSYRNIRNHLYNMWLKKLSTIWNCKKDVGISVTNLRGYVKCLLKGFFENNSNH